MIYHGNLIEFERTEKIPAKKMSNFNYYYEKRLVLADLFALTGGKVEYDIQLDDTTYENIYVGRAEDLMTTADGVMSEYCQYPVHSIDISTDGKLLVVLYNDFGGCI